MREIKFRAWTNRDKCWVGAFAVHKSGLWRESPNNEWTDLSKQEDVVLMQYTNLKDKNGKEIYEGDIVRCQQGCLHEVKWDNEIGGTYGGGMPGWYLDGLLKNNGKGYAWTGEEEIIGNIYESKHLLDNTDTKV